MPTPPTPPDELVAVGARAGPALDRLVLYLTRLVPVLESILRSQRFLLGDRMQGLALDLMEVLVKAQYRKQPRAALGAAFFVNRAGVCGELWAQDQRGRMGMPIEVLEAELLQLPKADRIRVLDRVVASLDTDAALDAAWDAVAAGRDAEAVEGQP